MNTQKQAKVVGVGKRTYRRYIVTGLELDNGLLVPLARVPRNPSKYTPHQGEREKARRRKQQEKQ